MEHDSTAITSTKIKIAVLFGSRLAPFDCVRFKNKRVYIDAMYMNVEGEGELFCATQTSDFVFIPFSMFSLQCGFEIHRQLCLNLNSYHLYALKYLLSDFQFHGFRSTQKCRLR